MCVCVRGAGGREEVGLNVNTVVIGGRQGGPIETANYSLQLFPLSDDSVKFLSRKIVSK